MSTLRDALNGVRQILLLQDQVVRLENEIVAQQGDLRQLADDLITIDKRLVRIETMVEMSMSSQRQAPRLPEG